MTRDEAIAEIQFHLGNRSDLFDRIVAELKRAQRLLEQGRSLPWFLKEEDATLALASGSADVAFPTGFLRENEDEAFHFTDSETGSVVYLEKINLRIGESRFSDEAAGQPIAYAIREGGWKFFPERDTAYTLNYGYYKSGGQLDSDSSDHLWLVNAPDILIGKAGSSIAATLQHAAAKAHFDEIFMVGWASAFAETVMREEENYPRAMGSRN